MQLGSVKCLHMRGEACFKNGMIVGVFGKCLKSPLSSERPHPALDDWNEYSRSSWIRTRCEVETCTLPCSTDKANCSSVGVHKCIYVQVKSILINKGIPFTLTEDICHCQWFWLLMQLLMHIKVCFPLHDVQSHLHSVCMLAEYCSGLSLRQTWMAVRNLFVLSEAWLNGTVLSYSSKSKWEALTELVSLNEMVHCICNGHKWPPNMYIFVD